MFCSKPTPLQVKTAAYLSLVLLVVGCVSTPAAKPENFGTFITPEGLKLFELRFAQPKREVRVGEPQREASPRREQQRLARERLGTLEATLAATGFCREGYTLLGRYAGETVERLRGECQERASEQDRTRFPNDILRW